MNQLPDHPDCHDCPIVGVLGRIEERMSDMEETCKLIEKKLFHGNGSDSYSTRLSLAEQDITGIKKIQGEQRKGRAALMLALATGFISMITSIVVAFIGGK
jgi:hypothetical protein